MVHPGGEGGIIDVGTALDGGEGHATFYVEVESLEAALSKIESLSGSRVMGPTDVPNGPRIALFTDPEGHIVGLFEAGSSRS